MLTRERNRLKSNHRGSEWYLAEGKRMNDLFILVSDSETFGTGISKAMNVSTLDSIRDEGFVEGSTASDIGAVHRE